MNIAVIGAGVLGRLISLRLIEHGHRLTLIDRQSLSTPNNAAWVSAGMLCPLGEIIHAPSDVVELGWKSLALWPQVIANLPGDKPVFFQRQGSLAVAFAQDRSSFEQWRQRLARNPNVQPDQIEWLDQSALEAREPALSGFGQAALLKAEGQLCNRSFIDASSQQLRDRAQVVEDQDVSLDQVRQLQADFDWVLDCRGPGAIENEWLTQPSTLRGVRGEVIRVHCSTVHLERPVRVMHPNASIYIVPKPGDQFVIGATEVESHSEHPITVRSTLELLNTLYCVHPAFAEASILESRVGIRCAYADNRPRLTQEDNRIAINGAYRHGWLTGPALAEQAVQLIEAA